MEKRQLFHLCVVSFFLCILLSFMVFYLTNALVDGRRATAESTYDGTRINGDSFAATFSRAVYQNSESLSFIRENAYRIFGIAENDNVMAGKDGFLFEIEDKENGYNYLKDYLGETPFTEEEMAGILSELRARQAFYKSMGATQYLLVILPNTQTVYSECLPAHLPRESGRTRRQMLTDYLDENEYLNYYDMTNLLLNRKADGELCNNTENALNVRGLYYIYQLLYAWIYVPGLNPELIRRENLTFYQTYTEGRDFAREAGLSKVARNRTVSLANDALLSYRFLYNAGTSAKTVRLPSNSSGVAANSPGFLFQFTNEMDRLQIERFISNTYNFVTYQNGLEYDSAVYEKANPCMVLQFIYENELSMLLPQTQGGT